MADNETKIVLQGEDRTGPAFKSAARNAGELERALRQTQAAQGRYGKEFPTIAEMQRRADQARRIANQTREQTREQERYNRALDRTSYSLRGMASRYTAMGLAARSAYQGVTDFAKNEEQLRVIQARTGAVAEQMRKLESTIEQTGDRYGKSNEEIAKTFYNVYDAGQMTLEQARRLTPALTAVARHFGVEGNDLAKSLGEFMNGLKIAPEQGEKALNILAGSVKNLRLDLDQLGKAAPELSEQTAELGVTGTEGLGQVVATLGLMREKGFGDTSRAAQTLLQSMRQIRSGEGVADALGLNAEQWAGVMERNIAAGGNFFDFYISRIKEARATGAQWSKLFSDPTQQRFWKMMLDSTGRYNELQARARAEMTNSNIQQAQHTKDLQQQLDELYRSWGKLWESVASFAVAVGANEFLQSLTTELRQLGETIKFIKSLTEKGLWDTAKDVFGRLHLPSMASVAQGMLNGPRGVMSNPNWQGPPVPPDYVPPQRATGGPVNRGQTYQVGEHGVELFTPSSNGRITPLDAADTSRTLGDVNLNTERSLAVLTQIRDMMRKQEQESGGGAGGGGASLLSSGSAAGSGYGGGGGPGARAGGGYTPPDGGITGGVRGGASVGGQVPRAMRRGRAAGDGASSGDSSGNDVGTDVGGNASLAEQRAPLWADVERDPATKQLMYQMMATEGGGAATVESLFNRVAMIRKKVPGYSIKDELRSGFYGPINSGKAQRTAITPAMRQRYDREIARVLGGSNIIQGRTDQGTYGDPNANGPGRVFFPGMSRSEIYNFWKGSRRGRQFTYQDSARFAEEQNARARASDGLNQPALTQRPEMPTEPPAELNAELQKIKDQRAELEKPIIIRAQLDRGQDNQFRRASMRREVNREVREAAWNSYNDIGAA